MTRLVLIFVFGGLGSVLRYLISGWGQRLTGGTFPTGTLVVNVLGCLAIGLSGALFLGPRLVREEYRLAIMVGLLGGFTTFSSFAWETFSLAEDGAWARALGNVALSNLIGLAGVWLGYRAGVRLFGG